MPLQANPLEYERMQGPWLRFFGRLAPGVTMAEAQAELTTVGRQAAAEFPDTNETLRPQVLPYTKSFMTPGSDRVFYMMELVMVMLLLVACANLANLVLARTATRAREIAIRRALGASRRRIVVQLSIEVLVLASISAVVGLLAVSWGYRWLDVSLPAMPFWLEWRLAGPALFFAAGLTVLSAIAAGALPAIKATRMRAGGLKDAAGLTGIRCGAWSTALVVTEVALSVAFLAGAVVLGQSLLRYQGAQVGFPADEFITAEVHMPSQPAPTAEREQYERDFAANLAVVHTEFLRRVAAEPRVNSVTFASRLPGTTHDPRFIEAEGILPPNTRRGGHEVRISRIDLNFFDAFDAPILQGRGFATSDIRATPGVVIVNESFARQVLGGQNPLGRRIRSPRPQSDPSPWLEIIGVVRDLGMNPGNPGKGAGLYRPIGPGDISVLRIAARVGEDPTSFTRRLRAIAADVAPAMRLNLVMPLDEAAWAERLLFRGLAITFATLSSMALVLAIAGIYALMSFTVSQRTREIGIRTALGARPSQIVASIFSRGLIQLSLGVAAGGGLGYGLLGILRLLPIELASGGPRLLLGVGALMFVVGLSACVLPALRGLRIQPTEALTDGT